ncbi:SCO family protein [Sinimarinibacterium sp. NLF-5-8]|uniref:SCO family protein n=1 Tax=Sinimarinibacterium sp. NLF-5-8 TaxID=2698684 RepID=UPI00137BC76E|nr:SCO family protein [Sinimarinibacterium sp. NLF-5-8]QHS09180.1 SCO family protein [Sinimarinibacterium sp. NLF-5-8]
MSQSSANKQLLTVLLAALALIGGVLAAAWLNTPKTVRIDAGTLLQTPRALPSLALTDENGATLDNAWLRDHWTLIFPGFTYCPDVCPTTLALLNQVQQQVDPKAQKLRVLLLSIDPERDTPELLKRYVSYFNPDFKAATTTEPALRNIAQALGVAYVKVPGKTDDSYSMDHSSALILIDPQGRIAGYFTPPLRVDVLSQDLRKLLESL